MAYSNTGLRLLVPGVGDGPALWIYSSTDAHTDVDAAGYFSDGADFGLKANDVMIVVDTDSATTTIHGVASATGINVATLS
jgi:hypothetical protein